MPLFREIECGKGRGGIWKITETFDELCDMLPHGTYYREYASRFAAERRRLEYVAVRLLIFTLTGEELQVGYLPSGRPFFCDGRFQLSISHTFGYAAVLLSEEYEAGLDIEAFSERIVKLKERIISPEEEAGTTYEILLHWSAKESVFKILDEEGIDFKENLTVRDLECSAKPGHTETEGDFFVCYHLSDGKKGLFSVHYETASDFVLTYTFRKMCRDDTVGFSPF